MKRHHATILSCGLAAAILAIPSRAGAAITIINGAMDGVANFSTFNGVVPSGWMHVGGSVDLFDPTTSFDNFAWQTSAGGGTFVHGIGFDNPEGFSQVITGLIPGVLYAITFEQSISHPTFTNGSEGFWTVTFGSESFDSDSMAVPGLGNSAPWQSQTMIFNPSATTQTLTFQARSMPSRRVDLGIDSVNLTVIPEPRTAVLLALGLLMLTRRR